MICSSSTTSTRMATWFGSLMGSCRFGHGGVLTRTQRNRDMQCGSVTHADAGRPHPSAQRANGVRAPVQPDSKVGLGRLRREPLLEHPLEVLRRNSNAIVRTPDEQLMRIPLAEDFRGQE